jgi:hypothetical protein
MQSNVPIIIYGNGKKNCLQKDIIVILTKNKI